MAKFTVKNTFRKGTKFYHNGTINAGDTVTSITVETVDDKLATKRYCSSTKL